MLSWNDTDHNHHMWLQIKQWWWWFSADVDCYFLDSDIKNLKLKSCIKIKHLTICFAGVAFNGTCANDGECTEANNVCTATKCACSTDSFRKGGTECATS